MRDNNLFSRPWSALLRFWAQDRGLSIFLALLVLHVFVMPALTGRTLIGRLAGDLLLSLLLLAGVVSISQRRRLLLLATICTLTAVVVRWTHWLVPAADLVFYADLASMATLSLLAIVVLAQVFRPGPVTGHRIRGAVAVYLLMGLIWAFAYELIAYQDAAAFAGAVITSWEVPPWTYYSFVTLTTMGYGDITPLHPVARLLAIAEALTGQLYLAILVARLVSQAIESKSEHPRP